MGVAQLETFSGQTKASALWEFVSKRSIFTDRNNRSFSITGARNAATIMSRLLRGRGEAGARAKEQREDRQGNSGSSSHHQAIRSEPALWTLKEHKLFCEDLQPVWQSSSLNSGRPQRNFYHVGSGLTFLSGALMVV
jgi:hypothetical protein